MFSHLLQTPFICSCVDQIFHILFSPLRSTLLSFQSTSKMKQALACLLYWSYVQLSVSFPVEEKPGFTLWPLGKRDLTPLTELQYSGLRGTQIGVFEKSHFGIPDPTCRNRLPQEGCWTMDQFTVDVSSQTLRSIISDTKLYRK
jgi:hypothetical protein